MRHLTMSENGINLLIKFEGMSKTLYLDTNSGIATIGISHILTRTERSSGKILINDNLVKYRLGLDNSLILNLLKQDLARFEKTVENVIVYLNQHKFDALVSFSFNVGVTAFENSTLLKLLNNGDYSEVPKQLKRWIYSSGKVKNGLIDKRRAEIELWYKF